ncbi:MAG: ABC transporter substrate-binding protein [Desulfobacteraceae bacterium]
MNVIFRRFNTVSLRIILIPVIIVLCTIIQRVDGSEGVYLTDAMDRRVRIMPPVNRIAVLPSDGIEVIRALKATDLVVGVNDLIKKKAAFWSGLADCYTIGHTFEPNYEQLVSLWPDLVLAYGDRPGQELEEKLLPLGIQVIRLDFYRLSRLQREVEDFGRLLGKTREAGIYMAWHAKCVSIIETRLKNQRKHPMIYLEGYTDYRASGPGSGAYEMGILAGGDIISPGYKMPSTEISSEFVVSRNPDIIVKLASGINSYSDKTPESLKTVRRDILQRPGLAYTTALKDGKVYVLSADIGPGPRGIIGSLYMAKIFYPEAFRDVDVKEIHREYMERFQGIPYRGYYAYPES